MATPIKITVKAAESSAFCSEICIVPAAIDLREDATRADVAPAMTHSSGAVHDFAADRSLPSTWTRPAYAASAARGPRMDVPQRTAGLRSGECSPDRE